MVKLASARESRAYGPRLSWSRLEYINAGLYVFATVLLIGGFASQLSGGGDAKSGLVMVLIGLAILVIVNAHDLIAHMAGIDYRFWLIGYDLQLGLVEFAVPVVQIAGTVLAFAGVLLFFIQAEKGYNHRMEKNALIMLIAGPVLWVVGSIHNACQVYERADGHAQMLQMSVQIPLLLGSLLFLVGAVFNWQDMSGSAHHDSMILGEKCVWLCLSGGLLFFLAGLLNVVRVFRMQQMGDGRLEKLRGGAQERLNREREGQAQVPLIREVEDSRRLRQQQEEEASIKQTLPSTPAPTPYKDVLLGGSQA